jgi:hypothetical protein
VEKPVAAVIAVLAESLEPDLPAGGAHERQAATVEVPLFGAPAAAGAGRIGCRLLDEVVRRLVPGGFWAGHDGSSTVQ